MVADGRNCEQFSNNKRNGFDTVPLFLCSYVNKALLTNTTSWHTVALWVLDNVFLECHMNDVKMVEKRFCWHCGRELTDRNSWIPTMGFDRKTPSFYCVGCQNAYYVNLSKTVGLEPAFFYCCVLFNVPFIAEVLPKAEQYSGERGMWGGYIVALRAAGYHKGEKWLGFTDGETDIRKVVKGMDEMREIATKAQAARSAEEKKREDREFWGTGPAKNKYKEDDYYAMNEIWDAMTADRASLSEQSKLAIKNICKLSLERDRCIEEKDFSSAQKLSAIIEKEKEGEQLRKKDEMPQDRARLDDIVLAVERAGLDMLDYDHLVEQLATKMFHTKYGYTRDAADQMLLFIRNCTAFNEGVAETDRLGEDYAIVDNLGEFMPEADSTEKQVYRELQITPLKMGE